MLYVLILLRALFAGGVMTLTIDSQLGTSIEDCFERISIGERVPTDAIYRNVSELTTKECEQICKQDKQCQSYDYGVGAKGNATCDLSKIDEKEIKEKNILQRHPDYDVYVRRFQCEQSPPSPIQTAMDDPESLPELDAENLNTPGHRPVFRPNDNSHLSDDYLVSSNIEYRPDKSGYGNHRPDYNNRDPYDEFNFNKPHEPYVDKPEYNYIIRPNRKPYQFRPEPYPNDGPVGPTERPYRPNRPENPHVEIYDPQYPGRPDFGSNYAEPKPGYGPPRINRPIGHLGAGYASEHGYGIYKPGNGYSNQAYNHGLNDFNQGSYGNSNQYSKYNNKNNYNHQSFNQEEFDSHNSNYGRPNNGNYQPLYGNNHGLYGNHNNLYGDYGSNQYASSHGAYNQAHNTNQGYNGYGSSQSMYGTQNYGSQSSNSYNDRPYKPSVTVYPDQPSYQNSPYEKPSYNDKPAYSQRPSYIPDRPGYGSTPSNDNLSYGSERPYSNDKPSYSSDRPTYSTGRPSYSSDKPSYGSDSSVYSDRPSYSTDRPSYINDRPSYVSDRPLYASDRPSYASDRPSYSSERPYNAPKPGYSDDKLYTERPYYPQKPLYGSDPVFDKPYNNKPEKPYNAASYDNEEAQKPSYSPEKPAYSDGSPGYGIQKPSYSQERPYNTEFHGAKPSYSIQSEKPYSDKPYGSYRPGYDTEQQIYGNRRPSYADKNYGNDRYGTYGYDKHASYSSNQASYSSQASYERNRVHNSNVGYGNNQGGYGNNQGGYGNNQGGYGNSQGGYGNNQSGYNGNQSGYGSNQGTYTSEQEGYVNKKTGYNQASYGTNVGSDQGGYGSNQGGYVKNQAGYGSYSSYDRNQVYNSNQASQSSQSLYGNNDYSYNRKPIYDNKQGVYGSSTVSYDNKAGYGNSQTNNEKNNFYNNQASYGTNQASYDTNQVSYSSNHVAHDRDQANYEVNQASYGTNQVGYDSNQANYGSNQSSYTNKPDTNQPNYNQPVEINETGYNIKPVYEYRSDGLSYVRPNGEMVSSQPVAVSGFSDRAGNKVPAKISYETCFRRVLAGRRALRSFVQKAVPCESLEECRRECATERRFPCESFNYRIDNSFRGRGLCELMTKPIEAFDVRRDFVDDKDFDFYELDRNSLEPNCQDTLKGPGILHSGFLSSKPDPATEQWDRSDWNTDKRHFERPPERHPEKQFVPYQIGLRRTNGVSHWGQYGGSYGGYDTYYKDKEDYRNSIKHWKTTDQNRFGLTPTVSNFDYHTLVKPDDPWKENRYGYGSWKKGRWNSSGESWNGLEYEESDFHEHNHIEEIGRSAEPAVKDCSSRRRPGMSLGSGAIRRSIFARNVLDCEAACFGERDFKCVSYSYRYSTSHGSDNCFLSERPYRGLELSTDSGSDVYAMPQDQDCVTIHHKPWVESECFWHVRSGAAVYGGVAKVALTVAGLGACEAECIRAQGFFCRGFSFRFESPTIGDELENCILTSSPPTSLESGRGLKPNIGHELYARGNYGRGCEPALYDDTHKESQCYLQYDNSARLTPSAVRGQAWAKDERSCGQACTDAPFRCLSFSYNNNAASGKDNCFLAEIRLFDLQEGVDYIHSTDDWLFAFDLFNGQCWRKVHGDGDYEVPSPELPRPISISGAGSEGPFLSSPHGPPEPFLSSPHGLPGPLSLTGPPGPTGPPRPTAFSGPSGPTGVGYIPDTSDHFIPSGPPSYIPSGPDIISGPSFRPGTKPYQPDLTPDFKPSYSELDYNPSHLSGSDHLQKPIYAHVADIKPNYPVDFQPHSETGYETYKPIEHQIKPYSGFKPGYGLGDSQPNYAVNHPDKPGYYDRPQDIPYTPHGYKPRPSYHIDNKPYQRPQDELNFKPGYITDNKPIYPTRLPEPKPQVSDFKPGFNPDYQRPGQKPVNNGPFTDRKPIKPIYHGDREEDNEPISVSWRHYTVSGLPCRSGTSCAQNVIAGHWACEPEGGEIGSWDYCCAPTHRCGYSEGFHKPWCYVGPSEDQWRPCSEKYYPYHQHKVPHPSQGHKDSRPVPSEDRPPSYIPDQLPPYLPDSDREYWDDLYKNGPQAYYDKNGNPLPGYARIPTESHPHIRMEHNYPQPGSGNWVQVPPLQREGQPPPPGLGAPRYWPVAYLHKGPPPNMTYFRYNETTTVFPQITPSNRELPDSTPGSIDNPIDYDHTDKISTESSIDRDKNRVEDGKINDYTTERHNRDDKKRNISDINIHKIENETKTTTEEVILETTEKIIEATNISDVEASREDVIIDKNEDSIKGIDDKLEDFSSVEVLDLDTKSLKTIEEEKQIEEIGRLLASKRDGKIVIEKRTQKNLESKKIDLNKDLMEFDFKNRFPVLERRGIIQKVTKEEINRDLRGQDKSLEVSETTFVRPPRVLSTTENVRKAIVNGKTFYEASVREQRDLFNARRIKSLNPVEERERSPMFGKKVFNRNVNPVRRVRRVFKKKYNPEEVRRRLLEREKSTRIETSKKV